MLVVDDNEVNREVATALLEDIGVEVTAVDSGSEAVEVVRNGEAPFDLVLMDIQMPEMDGLEVTRAIRALAEPRRASVPIVALSAHAKEVDRASSLAAGMNDHLTKPIEPEALRVALERWIGRGAHGGLGAA